MALTDSYGEFIVCELVYHDAHHVHFKKGTQSTAELHAVREQLKEVNHLLELAAAREQDHSQQIAEVQETLHECEVEATETCDSLRQQLAADKISAELRH